MRPAQQRRCGRLVRSPPAQLTPDSDERGRLGVIGANCCDVAARGSSWALRRVISFPTAALRGGQDRPLELHWKAVQAEAYQDEGSPGYREAELGAEPASPTLYSVSLFSISGATCPMVRLQTAVTLGCFPDHERGLLGWVGSETRSSIYLWFLTHLRFSPPRTPGVGPLSPALEAGPGWLTVS